MRFPGSTAPSAPLGLPMGIKGPAKPWAPVLAARLRRSLSAPPLPAMAPGAAPAAQLAFLAVLGTLLPGESGFEGCRRVSFRDPRCALKPWEDRLPTGWE